MFKYSIYKSFYTKYRTMLVMSKGKRNHLGYRELQLSLIDGRWCACLTDGNNTLLMKHYPSHKGLKTVINLMWT
jgi:hypothetical protein